MEGLELEHQEPTGSDLAYRVVARGEIDAATAPLLGQKFDELLAAGATVLLLDASAIDFVDSSGLRVIVAATNEIEGRGGRLLIEGISPAMERVLQVTGMLEKYKG